MRATRRSSSGWPPASGIASKRFSGNRRTGSIGRSRVRLKAAANARRLDVTPVPPARIADFERYAVKRERFGRGERAEHRRRNDAAFRFRDGLHVERNQAPRGKFGRDRDDRGVADAVARSFFFRDGESAMRRGDQGRLFGRDETAQHGSARFHQFGRHHHVNVARSRHQREHRLRAGPRRRHFDIVDRGAGPLRDARHRGGLRGPTLCLSERDDPIGEDASALSAHRKNCDRDSLRAAAVLAAGCGAVHPRPLAKAIRPAFRRRSNQPMIEARVRSTNRSQDEGLWTMSAR